MIVLYTVTKKAGFSLIELMAALAILVIVIAIATPTYIDYMNTGRVVSALSTLTDLERAAKIQYEENPTATSLSYGGATLANDTVTALDLPPVVNAMYVYPGGNSNVTSDSFLVCVYVSQLSFSGFVAPTPGTAGSYSRLCKQVTAGNNIYTNVCGALQGNSSDIPSDYLPTNCNCGNIWGGAC